MPPIRDPRPGGQGLPQQNNEALDALLRELAAQDPKLRALRQRVADANALIDRAAAKISAGGLTGTQLDRELKYAQSLEAARRRDLSRALQRETDVHVGAAAELRRRQGEAADKVRRAAALPLDPAAAAMARLGLGDVGRGRGRGLDAEGEAAAARAREARSMKALRQSQALDAARGDAAARRRVGRGAGYEELPTPAPRPGGGLLGQAQALLNRGAQDALAEAGRREQSRLGATGRAGLAGVGATAAPDLGEVGEAARLAKLRAQHAETPEGQAQLRQRAAAERQAAAANERYARAVRAAGGEQADLGAKALAAARGLGLVAFGAAAAARAAASAVQAASPSHADTLGKSFELFKARAGGLLLPLTDALSRSLQEAADRAGAVRHSALGKIAGQAAGTAYEGTTGGFLRHPIDSTRRFARSSLEAFHTPELMAQRDREMAESARSGNWFTRNLAKFGQSVLGPGKDDIARSYAGLPPSQVMGVEQYSAGLQGARMNTDPLQAKILAEQLANLGMKLDNVVTNTDRLKDVVPAWR